MDAHGDDAISFSSKGSTISGWPRHKMSENDKRAPIWRQLYLSRAKLKAVSRTSALIAGFAMIAMVEVQLDSKVAYPSGLLIAFSTVTTCLVSVHLFALMISTCLLPNIEAISNIHTLNAVRHSPHTKMRAYVEISWILSTGIGLILFLVEIALLIWLKFFGLCVSAYCPNTNATSSNNQTECATTKCGSNAMTAGWAAMAVLIPVTLIFAGFACHFYRSLAQHKYGLFNSAMKEITDLEMRQDNMSCRIRQPSALEGSVLYTHQDVSRMNSAASVPGGVHFRSNGLASEQLNIDQFGHEDERSISGRSTPSVDAFMQKEQ